MKIEHPSEYEWTFRDEVRMTMYENEDEFILEMVQPYVNKIMTRHIPKEVIKQAILTYSREHSDELEMLMEEYGEEQTCQVASTNGRELQDKK